MNQIKRINLFTLGDSTKLSTWSNLPYCFAKGLEDAGFFINRIDALPFEGKLYRFYEKIWYKFFNRILNKIFPNHIYSIDRSWFFRLLVNRNICQAIQSHSQVDLNLFLTYSYSKKYKNIPTLSLCDYTYEIFIKEKLCRHPNLLEKRYINYERRMVDRSDVVVNIFSNYAELMSKQFNRKVYFPGRLGLNVVSDIDNSELKALETKLHSKKIVFIGNQGNEYYVAAAKLLVDTFINLKQIYPDYELHLIGMDRNHFETNLDNVYCYGYLNKDNQQDKELYYSLLQESKIFVNTAGSFQATLEAMYFYTPIISSYLKETVAEFGHDILFGKYCEEINKQNLLDCIVKTIESPNYKRMCVNAHTSVAPYSWREYTKKVINLV